MFTRLDLIAIRQRRARVRDALFAVVIALAAVIATTSVYNGADAASPLAILDGR